MAIDLVIGGAPRSGSTILFNLMRILVRRIDPNVIAVWVSDIDEAKLDYWQKNNVSVIVKTHSLVQTWLPRLGTLLLTYRDPYELACSLVHKDGSVSISMCPKIVCEEYHLRSHLHLAYALDYRRLAHELPTLVVEVARAVQLPALDTRAVDEVVSELQALRPVAYGNDLISAQHPVTLLHRNHVAQPAATGSSSYTSRCEPHLRPLRQDLICQRLQESAGRMDDTLFAEVGNISLRKCHFVRIGQYSVTHARTAAGRLVVGATTRQWPMMSLKVGHRGSGVRRTHLQHVEMSAASGCKYVPLAVRNAPSNQSAWLLDTHASCSRDASSCECRPPPWPQRNHSGRIVLPWRPDAVPRHAVRGAKGPLPLGLGSQLNSVLLFGVLVLSKGDGMQWHASFGPCPTGSPFCWFEPVSVHGVEAIAVCNKFRSTSGMSVCAVTAEEYWSGRSRSDLASARAVPGVLNRSGICHALLSSTTPNRIADCERDALSMWRVQARLLLTQTAQFEAAVAARLALEGAWTARTAFGASAGGVHIRRGDKLVLEAVAIPTCAYADALANLSATRSVRLTSIFVASDEPNVPREFARCRTTKQHRWSVRSFQEAPTREASAEATVRLWAEIELLRRAALAVGTFTSNLARLVQLLRSQPASTFASLDDMWVCPDPVSELGMALCDAQPGLCAAPFSKRVSGEPRTVPRAPTAAAAVHRHDRYRQLCHGPQKICSWKASRID